MRRPLALGRLLTAALLLTLLPATGHATNQNCAWLFRLDPIVFNSAYPDEFANYWTLALPSVPGESLTIKGRYPHGRYMSFMSYNAALQAIDGLNDQRITADGGSINPFIEGNSRTDGNRNYTVTVQTGARGAASNTLYTDAMAPYFIVTYRVFRWDEGLDITGGVGLPSVTLNLPGGQSVGVPECTSADLPPNDLNKRFAEAGGSGSNGSQYPGENPPRWHKFYNTPTGYLYGLSEQERLSPTGLDDAIPSALSPYTMSLVPPGGFLNNLDNNYISAVTSSGHGPLLILRAKLPTTPQTWRSSPVMESGELRYWSLCTNEPVSQRYYACLPDDQVKLDDGGYFTIVVSTLANRPAAFGADGNGCVAANWLPAGPLSTLLIIRNMLPQPTFSYSIQNAGYGTEATNMGEYFPRGPDGTVGGQYAATFGC
ncbi:MAG: hypothetical protein ABR548_09305 [Actinomycetota bacterium]|nr:hypothetical protein [Actinomycetota bacterium]